MKPDGGPAFPQPAEIAGRGMTLRDYFAVHAPPYPFMMPTLELPGGDIGRQVADPIARWCFDYADAMLAERDK